MSERNPIGVFRAIHAHLVHTHQSAAQEEIEDKRNRELWKLQAFLADQYTVFSRQFSDCLTPLSSSFHLLIGSDIHPQNASLLSRRVRSCDLNPEQLAREIDAHIASIARGILETMKDRLLHRLTAELRTNLLRCIDTHEDTDLHLDEPGEAPIPDLSR